MRKYLSRAQSFLREVVPKQYLHAVFIVGAQKARTTSLFAYMTHHPMIAGSDAKELHFFDREAEYVKGLCYYQSRFPVLTSETHLLEATPNYLYREKVATRIHAFRQDTKIVAVNSETRPPGHSRRSTCISRTQHQQLPKSASAQRTLIRRRFLAR